jgi:hypothetical protein
VVTNTNGCVSAASAASVVTVNAVPAKPTITQSNGDLVSSSASGNQWYNGSTIITGATNANYRPTMSGYYKTQVAVVGCASPMSELYYYLITGINNTNTSSDNYQIMPNPVREKLLIQSGFNNNKTNFQIINATGSVLMSNSFIKTITIDLSAYSAGMYTILLTDTKTKKQESKQIIKL